MDLEVDVDENELKSVGAELFTDGRYGLRVRGWEIESRKRSILNCADVQQWEEKLQTSHLPEMVFGDSSLIFKHLESGTKIYFNAFDALVGWKHEGLPPVEVPAAAKWKFRRHAYSQNECRERIMAVDFAIAMSKQFQQVVLDYDYTFTTPYFGSEMTEVDTEKVGNKCNSKCSLKWEDCKEKIDLVALAAKEPILFYDEVILYEDELADNGISLLTVKVRVMPSGWFLLLRFWLRVDGVLMRLRDTRMHCTFGESAFPVILRESCWREATFSDLAAKGYSVYVAAYNDPNIIDQRLPVIMHKTQKLQAYGL